MPLDKEFPLQYLDGEAPFWMKLSQVGSNKQVLIILWGLGMYLIVRIGDNHGHSWNLD
jgi:hypothetical protein